MRKLLVLITKHTCRVSNAHAAYKKSDDITLPEVIQPADLGFDWWAPGVYVAILLDRLVASPACPVMITRAPRKSCRGLSITGSGPTPTPLTPMQTPNAI